VTDPDAPASFVRRRRPREGIRDTWRPHPFWTAIFGNVEPVEVEIGPGDGSFLITAAAQRPQTNFLGIERSRARARRLAIQVARSGAPRVRVLHANAECVIRTLIPPDSVAAYHVYFPDPWPKRRHTARRLFTTDLIARLADTLVPGGCLSLATDVYGYMRLIHTRVMALHRFRRFDVGPPHPGLDTGFARKYRARGRTIYSGSYRRCDPSPDSPNVSLE